LRKPREKERETPMILPDSDRSPRTILDDLAVRVQAKIHRDAFDAKITPVLREECVYLVVGFEWGSLKITDKLAEANHLARYGQPGNLYRVTKQGIETFLNFLADNGHLDEMI
jgi:hypothetical protein